jgi:hypothetical protein
LDGHQLVNPNPLENPSNALKPLIENNRATLLSIDACLGIEGLPQSASGQATLLTGQNVPEALGYHYGPKPNTEIANILKNGNLFDILRENGRRPALLNAFPRSYFEALNSGRRLPGAIAMAVRFAGLPLFSEEELYAGRAISADLTGQGWRDYLGYPDAPVCTPYQAGVRLAELGAVYDFALFEFWLSDLTGHRRDMDSACNLLENFDQTLNGILDTWDAEEGLILITSDHGNLEDLSTRRHTINPVPALLIGSQRTRSAFTDNLIDIADIAPAILRGLLNQ